MNELDLFTAALACETAEARQALLDQHCQGNPRLRQRLEELLSAYHQADQVLPEVPVIDANLTKAFTNKSEGDLIGTMIAGKYKLLEEIGEGGMGTVFVAEQTEPVKRKVAVKLIKPGMDSKSVLARFEAERQALAMMDHPNIARVLDAGLTEERRPYFVMEYIKGLPLTKYCDDAKLSIEHRLQLFVQICQAVQHAHQKGIIHRDLKPGNILIALYDGKPVPKIIDFGLAKALHQSLTDRTLHTGHEMVLGTPLYMSPEQAELNNLDIDTRSDIYSLGVILYELLTGVTPLEKQRFKEAAWAEVLRIIKEEEPSKPSTKLSQSNSLPSVAAQRQMEPKKLSTLLKGDLDWIVMKALEKDRSRRYETANGFAADVMRYLSGEAVSAVPPSTGYRLKKFVKRNRGKVLAASLLVGTLILGVAGTTWGLLQARSERDLAEIERQNAVHERDEKEKARQAEADRAEGERRAKLEAQTARDKEARERSYAQAIADFVVQDFLALTSVEGQARFDGQTLNKNSTLRELLDRAADKLKSRHGLAPHTEGVLCWIIGVSYRSIGESTRAIPLLERSVELHSQASGTDGEEALMAKNSLAVAYGEAGFNDRAVTLFEEVLKQSKIKRGAEHMYTLHGMGNLASAYITAGKYALGLPLAEDNLKLTQAKLGNNHDFTIQAKMNLALAYLAVSMVDQAIPLFNEAYRQRRTIHGADHPFTLMSMAGLANGYTHARKYDLAVLLLEELVKLQKSTLGAEHPTTIVAMSQLALCYQLVGKLDLAIPIFENDLKQTRIRRGEDHPQTLSCLSNLGMAYLAAGNEQLALPLLQETLKGRVAKLGPIHPVTLTSMSNLGQAYVALGQYDKALPIQEEVFRLQKQTLGIDHHETLSSLNNLAMGYHDIEKYDRAMPLFEQSYQLQLTKFGPNDINTLTSLSNLGLGYADLNQYQKAVAIYEESLQRHQTLLGAEHPNTLNTMTCLATGYSNMGKMQLAFPLYEKAFSGQKEILGVDHPKTLITMYNLAESYLESDQFEKAISLFQQQLKLVEAKRGRSHPETQKTLASLGICYKLTKRYDEAIKLFNEVYPYSKQHASLKFVRRNLMDAYDQTGRTNEFAAIAREVLADDRQNKAMDPDEFSNDLAWIGKAFLDSKAFAEAEIVLRECLELRMKQMPDDYRMFNTMSMLGGALLGRAASINAEKEKSLLIAEAERLLLRSYAGLKKQEKSIPPVASTRIPQALDRLIQLYTETNKPDEVKKWQAEKDKLPRVPEKK